MVTPLFPDQPEKGKVKVTALFDESPQQSKPKVTSLFEDVPTQKKVNALFSENNSNTKPKTTALFAEDNTKKNMTENEKARQVLSFNEPKTTALFTEDNSTKPIVEPQKLVNALSFNEPIKTIVNEGTETYYLTHKLLKSLPKKRIDRIIEIEKNIQLNSSVYVVNYAEKIQERVNKVMSSVADFSLKLLEADMSTWVQNLITELKKMAIENFRGAKPGKGWFFSQKVLWTVRDYVETYNIVATKSDGIVSSMDRVVDGIITQFGKFDKLFADNADVIEDLDNHVIAGRVALGRHEGQLFTDFGTTSCHEQFGQKINDLDMLQHSLELNAHQIRLMQNNFMTKLNSVRSVIGSTYPIWKSNFSTMLNKWQASGTVNLDTDIDTLIDLDFSNFIDNHKKIVDGLGKS